MANMILAFPNYIDGCTLSGGSWQTTLPRSNIQDRKIGKLARTSNDSSGNTYINITFPESNFVQVVSLINHNISPSGKWRITASDYSDFSSLIYDSGTLDVWGTVYPFGYIAWGFSNFWNGDILQETLEGWVKTVSEITDDLILAKYWRIQIIDETNPDGYIQMGRIFIGRGWSPSNNMDYGASMQWNSDSDVVQAISGAEFFNPKNPYRSATFKLSNLDIDEGLSEGFDLTRRAGIDKECFFIFDSDDIVNKHRRQFLCRLRKLSQIEYPYFDRTSMAFEVKELI